MTFSATYFRASFLPMPVKQALHKTMLHISTAAVFLRALASGKVAMPSSRRLASTGSSQYNELRATFRSSSARSAGPKDITKDSTAFISCSFAASLVGDASHDCSPSPPKSHAEINAKMLSPSGPYFFTKAW
eukprot:8409311-Pyramimonas_sp.AAC.1